jgi:hypothetical protein
MDPIFDAFLKRQFEQGMALTRESDLVELAPVPDLFDLLRPAVDGVRSPSRYVARFFCRGLARDERGEVVERGHFEVGIWFPPDYCRRADPFQTLAWLGPVEVFHPNISGPRHAICVGPIRPGTGLPELLYRCFDVITWNNVTMSEANALDWDACQWARNNRNRFPVDRRPLKRRTLEVTAEPAMEQP